MTRQEIEKEINDEFTKFMNSKFPNILPKNFMELFKKALMKVDIGKFQLRAVPLKEVLTKNLKDLTVTEVGIMCNVITSVPFEGMYQTLDEALNSRMRLENVIIEFNTLKRDKEVKLTQKKETMINLTGAGGGSILAKA